MVQVFYKEPFTFLWSLSCLLVSLCLTPILSSIPEYLPFVVFSVLSFFLSFFLRYGIFNFEFNLVCRVKYLLKWSRPNSTWWCSFLFNKTNRRTNFPNLFCQETLHVSGSSPASHQEFSTVHSALIYVMQVWWQLSSTTRMELRTNLGN